jgi:hypothetical protein
MAPNKIRFSQATASVASSAVRGTISVALVGSIQDLAIGRIIVLLFFHFCGEYSSSADLSMASYRALGFLSVGILAVQISGPKRFLVYHSTKWFILSIL